jgi:hypothetical protein
VHHPNEKGKAKRLYLHRAIHPFLGLFRHAFFSYELGRLNRDPEAFS